MKCDRTIFVIWLYRLLVVIAVLLMIWSFIMPWWTAGLSGIISKATIDIYAYGIPNKNIPAGVMDYISRDITPLYQTVLAWIYLGISVVLALSSTWIKGRKGQVLLAIVGAGFIIYALTAVYGVIAARTAAFDIPLQGWANMVSEGTTTKIITSLTIEYYLAYASGGVCILLALLRDVVLGKFTPRVKQIKNIMEAE